MKMEKVTIENALRDYENYAIKTVDWDMEEASAFLRALAEIPENSYKFVNQNGVIKYVVSFGIENENEIYSTVIWLEKTNFEAIYNSLQAFKIVYDLNRKHDFSYTSETAHDLFANLIAKMLVRVLEVFGNAICMEFLNDYSIAEINEKL